MTRISCSIAKPVTETSYSESSTEIATELTAVNAEITAYELIMSLPEFPRSRRCVVL